ncbi:MAG: rhodanese-like domain-containing protein [Pseudomonadota bacterium]|nr:rhodanese-like domain-containing protein [Pseudomonadota bacterium]
MSSPSLLQVALVHTAFYKFTQLRQPEDVAVRLREMLAAPQVGRLTGSILVATEGINGMLAGTRDAVDRIEQALLQDPAFAGAFDGMAFRRSACTTRPFGKMKVHVKKEIVPLGIDGVDGRRTGITVSPQQWRELIKDPELVLLDNRNSFEYRLGHFEGAVDPGVTNFRDFPAYVLAHAAQWKAQGTRIAMYCTGGVRCEKTSAWMRDMDLPVYQLEGGILNYFEQVPDAQRDWRGECFVFDNRVALDTRLQETASTLDDVYREQADGAWRLARGRRLEQASGESPETSLA